MPPQPRRIALAIPACNEHDRAQAQVQQAFEDARIGNALKLVGSVDHLLDRLHQRGPSGGEIGAAPRPEVL